MFAVGQDHPRNCYLVHGPDRFADDGIGVVSDLAIGDDLIGPHEIELIDFRSRDEFVDVDRPGAFQRNVLKLILVDGDIGVGVDFVLMMSSEGTSSPVSASTLVYLMRWPVCLLI
jgi:hypothetical protein